MSSKGLEIFEIRCRMRGQMFDGMNVSNITASHRNYSTQRGFYSIANTEKGHRINMDVEFSIIPY